MAEGGGDGLSTRGQRSSAKKSAQQGRLVWSIVKSQFQALCKTLSGAGVESLVLTSQGFQYCGSEKGVKFLQDKVGLVPGLKLEDKQDGIKPKGEKSTLTWEIVETQFAALVKTLSDMGVESLILTSIMTEKFGFCGSTRGLKFLKDNPKISLLFKTYCTSPKVVEMAKNAKNSVFGKWYSLFPEEEEEVKLDDLESSGNSSAESPKAVRVSSRLAQKDTPKGKDAGKGAEKEKVTPRGKRVGKGDQKEKDTPKGKDTTKTAQKGKETPKGKETEKSAQKDKDTPKAKDTRTTAQKEKHMPKEKDTPKESKDKDEQKKTPIKVTEKRAGGAEKEDMKSPTLAKGSQSDVIGLAAGRSKRVIKKKKLDSDDEDEVPSPKRGQTQPSKSTPREQKSDDSTTPRRGRGRPRKEEEETEEEETPTRGRGRQRKEEEENEEEEIKTPSKGHGQKEKEDEAVKSSKRGRGRPRKEDEKEDEVTSMPKRGHGQQKKGEEEEDMEVEELKTPKTGRGKQRKDTKEQEEETEDTPVEEKEEGKGKAEEGTVKSKEGSRKEIKSPETKGKSPIRKSDETVPSEAGEKETENHETDDVEKVDESSSVKKGRGRPPKRKGMPEDETEKDKADLDKADTDKSDTPVAKKGRGRPPKSRDESGAEMDIEKTPKTVSGTVVSSPAVVDRPKGMPAKGPVQTPRVNDSRADDTMTPGTARKSSRLAEIRIKEEPDTSEYERRASGRKKAYFECDECKETFFMEYLLLVHQRKCRREARLMASPKPATPGAKRSKDQEKGRKSVGGAQTKNSAEPFIVSVKKEAPEAASAEVTHRRDDGPKAVQGKVAGGSVQTTPSAGKAKVITVQTSPSKVQGNVVAAQQGQTNATHTLVTANEQEIEIIEAIVQNVEGTGTAEEENAVEHMEVEELLDDNDEEWYPNEEEDGAQKSPSKKVKKRKLSPADTAYLPKRSKKEARLRALKYKQILDILNIKPQSSDAGESVVEPGPSQDEESRPSHEEAPAEEQVTEESRESEEGKEATNDDVNADTDDIQIEFVEEPGEDDYLDVATIESMVDLDSPTCAICGMTFKDAKYMRKHLITHSATKNYTCQVCTKKFMRRYDLHQHLIRIHAWVKTGRGLVVDQKRMIREKSLQIKKERGEDSCSNDGQEGAVVEGSNDGEVREEGEISQSAFDVINGLEEGEVPVTETVEETYNPRDPADVSKVLADDNVIIDNRRKQIGNFECPFCKMICNTRLSLDQHMERVHEDEMGFECKDCDAKFNKYAKLQRHISASHTEKRYGCSVCGKLFKYFYTCKEHEKIHTESKTHLCDLCGKGFSLLKYLLKHMERHQQMNMETMAPQKLFPCKYCESVFDDLRLYQNHMRQHTDVEDRIHHCDQCPKRFFKATHLKRHMLTHTNVRPHQCEICHKCYKDKDTLRKHQKYYHPPDEGEREMFPCMHCPRVFYNKGHLKRHLVKHTGEKPFVCPTCNRGFGEKKSLENHIRIHTGERPYKCNECDKAFIQLSHLRRHRFLHSQVRDVKCEECGKCFFEKADLQKHQRVHTKDRPYKCDLCPMSFSQQNILKCHRRRHTGEKPYVCDICDRAFTQMGAMQCHRRLHTGERPYKCKYCGMGFVSKERMKFHTYSHTGINPHICHICGKGFRLKFKLQSHLDSHDGVYRYQCAYCSKGFIERAKLSRHIKQVHTDVDGNQIQYTNMFRPAIVDGKEIGEDGVITVITTRAPVSDDQEEPIVEYVTQIPAENTKQEQEVQQEVVETVETVTVPFDSEENSAISHIQFEGDSEVTQATAANLAALYAGETTEITMPSDSIIYHGDGENGEEVVYVVIPEDNQTVILS